MTIRLRIRPAVENREGEEKTNKKTKRKKLGKGKRPYRLWVTRTSSRDRRQLKTSGGRTTARAKSGPASSTSSSGVVVVAVVAANLGLDRCWLYAAEIRLYITKQQIIHRITSGLNQKPTPKYTEIYRNSASDEATGE